METPVDIDICFWTISVLLETDKLLYNIIWP